MAYHRADFRGIALLAAVSGGCGAVSVRPEPEPTPSAALAADQATYLEACTAGCDNATACLGDPDAVTEACRHHCTQQAGQLDDAACAHALIAEARCFAELDCSAVDDYFGDAPDGDSCAAQAADVVVYCTRPTP